MKLNQSQFSATESLQGIVNQGILKDKRMLGFFVLLLALTAGVSARASQTGNTTRLSKTELNNLLTNAKTAADHQRLAQYFTANAAKLEAEAQDYDQRAEQFRSHPSTDEYKRPMTGRTYAGCRFIADKLHKKAAENQQLAAEQVKLAAAITR